MHPSNPRAATRAVHVCHIPAVETARYSLSSIPKKGPSSTSLRPHITHQPPLELLTPYRHLQLIKRVLHHIIRIQLIHLPHNRIHIRLARFREQQKLRAREGLEAIQPEGRGFEDFDTCALVGGDGEGGGGERFGDGVDAVEGAGEDEQVVDGDGVEVGGEGAVVDEAAGFVDDDEGVDDPGGGG